MKKIDIINFFDNAAKQWDTNMIRNNDIINQILDNANVSSNKNILDVACGTGVLIPDYLSRNVNSVTAVDISPQMIEIAKSKFPQENVHIICADIETIKFNQKFDCIIVYNAFPHFPDPVKLIKTLTSHLTPNGTLTIAHGMSRDNLEKHHSGAAKNVSIHLLHEDELAAILEPELKVIVKISNDKMYQVVGQKIYT